MACKRTQARDGVQAHACQLQQSDLGCCAFIDMLHCHEDISWIPAGDNSHSTPAQLWASFKMLHVQLDQLTTDLTSSASVCCMGAGC